MIFFSVYKQKVYLHSLSHFLEAVPDILEIGPRLRLVRPALSDAVEHIVRTPVLRVSENRGVWTEGLIIVSFAHSSNYFCHGTQKIA
jgi:hypothetical protein